MAACISSLVTVMPSTQVSSIREPVMVGTLCTSIQFAFQFRQHQADGLGCSLSSWERYWLLQFARRRSPCCARCIEGVLVVGIGCTVVMLLMAMPKSLCSTCAMGARQLVVQEAQEMMVSDPSRISWFTLKPLFSYVAGCWSRNDHFWRQR